MVVKRKTIHNLVWQKLVPTYRRDINKFPKICIRKYFRLLARRTYRRVYTGKRLSAEPRFSPKKGVKVKGTERTMRDLQSSRQFCTLFGKFKKYVVEVVL